MKKNTITLLICFLVTIPLLAQTVTTFTDGTPDDDIAIDSNGNIYCSNYVGDTVFKFTPSGVGTPFITGLITPNGLAFNSNDELYVCDGQGDTIYKYDINGTELESYDNAGNLDHPSGIVKSFDSDTMIFTEFVGNKIKSLAPDGTIDDISLAPELNGPVGLAIDESGVLYVGNYNDREIFRVLAYGDLEYIAQLPTDGGPLPNLGFIAYAQGMLWGTTMGSDKIYAVNPNAVDEIFLFAGSAQGSMDGDINQATFNTPNGITFDTSGNTMYITDFGTKNLRIISDVVLEVEEITLKKSEVRLFPNPSKEVLNISASLPQPANYTIVASDISGKEIFKKDIISGTDQISETINVSSWSSGTYLIEIRFDDYTIAKKMVK